MCAAIVLENAFESIEIGLQSRLLGYWIRSEWRRKFKLNHSKHLRRGLNNYAIQLSNEEIGKIKKQRNHTRIQNLPHSV